MPTSLTIAEAAAHFGLSESTVRRRIKDGTLTAFKQPTTQGYEWRIRLPTTNEQVGGRDDHIITQEDEQGHSSGDQVPIAGDRVATTGEYLPTNGDQVPTTSSGTLIEELRRLHAENMQLAGQVGFLQAKLQDAQEQIRLLTVTPVRVEADTSSSDQHAPNEHVHRPWWKRLLGT